MAFGRCSSESSRTLAPERTAGQCQNRKAPGIFDHLVAPGQKPQLKLSLRSARARQSRRALCLRKTDSVCQDHPREKHDHQISERPPNPSPEGREEIGDKCLPCGSRHCVSLSFRVWNNHTTSEWRLRVAVSLTGGQSQASIFNELRAWLQCAMEGEMVNQPTAEDRLIDRRSVLRTGAALAPAPRLMAGRQRRLSANSWSVPDACERAKDSRFRVTWRKVRMSSFA